MRILYVECFYDIIIIGGSSEDEGLAARHANTDGCFRGSENSTPKSSLVKNDYFGGSENGTPKSSSVKKQIK